MTASQILTTEIERVDARAGSLSQSSTPSARIGSNISANSASVATRFATRWFARLTRSPGYYERFAASIDQMVLESAASSRCRERRRQSACRPCSSGRRTWRSGVSSTPQS